jgi:DNA-binding response OmpR family regulator
MATLASSILNSIHFAPSVLDSPPTILLAEEDESLRDALATELSREGFQVVEVEDGMEAEDYLGLTSLQGGHLPCPSMIVSDVSLSGSSGLELLSHLRAMNVHTPFIFINAVETPAFYEQTEGLDASYVLPRPIQLEDLKRAIFDRLMFGAS